MPRVVQQSRPLVVLLLILCLFLLCPSPAFALVEDEEMLTELLRLRGAISQHDVDEVRRIIFDGKVKPLVASRAPTPLYWVADEKVDSEKLASIAHLLLWRFGDGNYDYDKFHPLTRAVHHRLTQVVTTLLRSPDIIKEVVAKYLWCEDLVFLPQDITVVLTPDSHDCFRKFPRVVDHERSKLVEASQHRKMNQKQQERQSSKDDEEVTPGEFDWSNPFSTPPPGKKPPSTHYVMNPRAFTDFSEAVVYYFLGEWSSFYTTTFWVVVFAFWFFMCGIFVSVSLR